VTIQALKPRLGNALTGIIAIYRAGSGVAPTPPPVPTPAPPLAPPPIPTSPPAPGVVAVMIVQGADFAFSPATITIPLGTSVRWTNATSAPHTVTASGSFDSGTIPPGGTYTRTFNQLGTFTYLCAIHPNMTGSVIVTNATNPSATPTSSDQAQVALIKHDGNYSFSPAELSIRVGTVVTWINTTGDALTVDGPDFQSPLLPKEGGTWNHTFTVPGTYSYTSRLRPEMTGTILVSP
jgi:plastocyanin